MDMNRFERAREGYTPLPGDSAVSAQEEWWLTPLPPLIVVPESAWEAGKEALEGIRMPNDVQPVVVLRIALDEVVARVPEARFWGQGELDYLAEKVADSLMNTVWWVTVEHVALDMVLRQQAWNDPHWDGLYHDCNGTLGITPDDMKPCLACGHSGRIGPDPGPMGNVSSLLIGYEQEGE